MKGYTDWSQSKKLAGILPLESADQTWERIAIAGANLDVPEELQYRHNGDMPFKHYSGIGVPCWSLATLLNALPRIKNLKPVLDLEFNYVQYETYDIDLNATGDNPVDACYELILKLNELNLL